MRQIGSILGQKQFDNFLFYFVEMLKEKPIPLVLTRGSKNLRPSKKFWKLIIDSERNIDNLLEEYSFLCLAYTNLFNKGLFIPYDALCELINSKFFEADDLDYFFPNLPFDLKDAILRKICFEELNRHMQIKYSFGYEITLPLKFIQVDSEKFSLKETEKLAGFPAQTKNKKSTPSISDSERDNLLKTIGVIALGYAEKSQRYRRGDTPNANAIAEDVAMLLENLPDIKSYGLGNSSIRERIREGITLLKK